MRARTPKRAAQERAYLKERAVWLVGKMCSRCGKPADTIQHAKGRRGDLLLDKRWWIPLCWNPCHSWVTEHPAEATAQGYALSRVGS